MRHWRRALSTGLVLAAGFLGPRFSAAQGTLPAPGDRVRISAPDHGMSGVIGRLLRLTTDSITINPNGEPVDVTLALHDLSRLEVSTERHAGLGLVQGGFVGLGLGTLVGVGLGGLLYLTCNEDCGLWFVIMVPAGAASGLLIGSALGATRPPDQWQDIPLSRPGESGMLRRNRTLRIGLSIAF